MRQSKSNGAVASVAALFCATLLAVNSASAAITTFAGGDSGVGPAGLRPGSDAAAASFDAAAGSSTLINFESVALGNTGSFTAAPGVSAAYSGNDNGGGIVTTSSLFGGSDPTHLGYNTTAGGSEFFAFVPLFTSAAESLTLSFATPVSGFGAYFTGTQSGIAGSIHIVFNDGSSKDLSPSKNLDGGVQFFGFVDPGTSISSITVSEVGPFSTGRDILGIDDIRLVPAAVSGGSGVPLPLGALAAVPLMGALALWNRRRNVAC